MGLSLLVGLAALALVGPLLLAPILRRVITAQLEDRLGVAAALEDLSFSWSGKAHLVGLELAERTGEPLLRVGDARASVGVLALLSGSLRADLEVLDPEIHLRQDPDGRWNLERLAAATSSGEADRETRQEAAEELPGLQLSLGLSGGRVFVHGQGGTTELSELRMKTEIEALDRPGTATLSFDLRGPSGPAGSVSIEAGFTAAADGELGLEGLRGRASFELVDLDLEGLAPALALVAPIEGISGIVAGRSELDLGQGLSLQGSIEVLLRELALEGTRPGAPPVRIPEVRLTGRATQEGSGAGTQELELAAGEVLAVRYAGSSSLSPNGAGEVTGVLDLSGSLGPLGEIMAAWVPIQEGVRLEGRLAQRVELSATLRSRQPTAVRVTARGGFDGIGARDGAGRALDLSELRSIALELEARADLEAGDVQFDRCDLRAGPIELVASLDARGLLRPQPGAPPDLRSGSFSARADLERLRGLLRQVVELGSLELGGTFSARGEVSGEGGALALDGRVEARSLALAELALASLEGEWKGARTASGGLEGSLALRIADLALGSGNGPPLRIPGLALDAELHQDAALIGVHRARLRTTDGALELVLQIRTEPAADESQSITAELALDGDVAGLAGLLRPRIALRPGIGGKLHAQGNLRAGRTRGELSGARGGLELTLSDLSVQDEAGQALPLGALARSTAELELSFEPAAGTLELERLALQAGPLRLDGSGGVRQLGSAAGGPPELLDSRLELDCDLAALGATLDELVDLGGLGIAGEPLHGEVGLASRDGRIEARGSVRCAGLVLQRDAARPIEQRELALELDLSFDPREYSLECRSLAFSSGTARARAEGRLTELRDTARSQGEFALELSGELGRVLSDLGLEGPESGRRSAGDLSLSLALSGDQGRFQLQGRTSVSDFEIELAPPAGQAGAAPGEPVRLADPRIALVFQGSVALAEQVLDLESLRLDSTIARGAARGRLTRRPSADENGQAGEPELVFEGLTGELSYVPDRLGAVLAPWIPGKLSGAEEERLTIQFDGRARELDLGSLLHNTRGRAQVGLGEFARPEAQLAGDLVLALDRGRTELRGDLRANGGLLDFEGLLDFAPNTGSEPRSTLKLNAQQVRLNSRLAPLLGLFHPAFAHLSLAEGQLEGICTLSLDLSYDGPLSIEDLELGWPALRKDPINGTGRLELEGVRLLGSPVLELLEDFGLDGERALDVRPIVFHVRRGRVHYAKPWTWTISGVETTFGGSIGLDETLDLSWSVPIEGALLERYDFLEPLRGETIQIPLRGTLDQPRLETGDLLKALAARAARAGLGSRLGLGGGQQGHDDPAALLAEADELWEQGKKVEAARIYERLKDDFKLTLTYALNKDRIKERAKYRPQ